MYKPIDSDSPQELVERYAPLVKRIAHHLMARLPANVMADDLVQSGMIGLLEAAKKYDPGKGASFETYAGIRIRGSIIDEIRKGDWTPRSVHRNSRRIAEGVQIVEARTGRDASDLEVAEQLGVSIDEYLTLLKDTAGSRLYSFDEILEQGEKASNESWACNRYEPMAQAEKSALFSNLIDEIGNLPEREQLVMALYYDEELNLKEIGLILGVSESRVSQIHSQAALRLRSRMAGWKRDNSA